MNPVVYILHSEKLDKFYIGYSLNFEQRLEIHNSEQNTKWTKRGRPWIPFLIIECSSKKQAMAIEKYLKNQKSRQTLLELKSNEQFVSKLLSKFSSDC
jgi:putative endonuclease